MIVAKHSAKQERTELEEVTPLLTWVDLCGLDTKVYWSWDFWFPLGNRCYLWLVLFLWNPLANFSSLPRASTQSSPNFLECSVDDVIVTMRSSAWSFKVGTHEETRPRGESRGEVPLCEMAIFASTSSRRNQTFVSATGPTNSNQFEIWDKSLRLFPSCKIFKGLVAGT